MTRKVVRPDARLPLLASIVTAVGLGCIGFGTATAQEEYGENLQRGTFARAIERQAPRFPSRELRQNRQGWVVLSYVVTEEGAVIDPVIQDSSGSRHFERAAQRVVKKWTFEPATWMGEPTEQCHNEVMVSFVIRGTNLGASRRFISRFKKADKQIERGNLEDAKSQIEMIFATSQISMYELSRLWILRAKLAKATGDRSMELSSYRKASAGGGKWIEDDIYAALLESIVILELKLGLYSSAVRHFEKLPQLKTEPDRLSKLSRLIGSIKDQVASEKIIAIPARLRADRQCEDCSADWQYRPMRRKFSIANIKGTLSSLEIRCDWRRVVDSIEEDVSWSIPESWGSCSIMVFGEKGSSFSFLELPDSA